VFEADLEELFFICPHLKRKNLWYFLKYTFSKSYNPK
jgi:tRNA splicing ligase